MTAVNPAQGPNAGKGKAFFDRAEQVAETGNWDFAIEMYLEGIQREPENVARGHQPLREVSLKRKSKGGKGAGMMEQMKRRPVKDPVTSLVNAEYLLAKEPGSVAYMVQMVNAAVSLGHNELTKWICDILQESQRQASKPDRRVLVLLMKTYEKTENYNSAIVAAEMARKLSPDDAAIGDLIKELGAKATIKKGKYDQEGDFSKGVKDMAMQKKLAEQGSLKQSTEFLQAAIEEARQQYLASPLVQGKIIAVVDALLKPEDESYENEAIDVLTKANKDTGAYQFKMRIGEIRMKQMTRRYRKLVEEGDKAAAAEQAKRQLAYELEEFAERAINYPTDLEIKYELGRRQLLSGKLDEAIASFQVAQRAPRKHLAAMNYLGQAFMAKKWYREAAETYEKVLGEEVTEERAKELRYNFGDVLEKMADTKATPEEKRPIYLKAQDEFSRVAMTDFNYRDTRVRIENVRKKIESLNA